MEDDEEELEDISDVIFHELQDGSSVFNVEQKSQQSSSGSSQS